MNGDEAEASGVLNKAISEDGLDPVVRVHAAIGLLIWSVLQSIADHLDPKGQ